MSYLVLARKWRPSNFTSMVGQEHVRQALVNSLKQLRLHHAYLFTGTRGVGKTTIARILAKALNCEQGISAEPCGDCQACQEINLGHCVDVIEIDAASRTKVEDTREILDNVQYAPSRCRFKIYIIDEVHMLSGHSFNALLKTLEEPPEHVKFLLATTDPQKLPVTVLSRCLQFHLKNMLPEQISAHLSDILDQENIRYQATALDLIAQAAEGSMRDALSLLDQAIAYSAEHLEEAIVRQMLGYTEHTHLIALLMGLANRDATELLTINRQLLQQGADFYRVLADLLDRLHQITLLQLAPQCDLINAQQKATLTAFATHFTQQDIQLFYQIALKGRNDLAMAPTPLVGFDMIVLRMLAFQPVAIAPLAMSPALTSPQPIVAPSTTTPHIDWETIIPQLKLTGIAHNIIQHCIVLDSSEHHLTLALEPGHQSILTLTIRQRIQDALTAYFQRKITLNFEIAAGQLDSPARQQQQADEQRLNNAKQALQQDSQLNKVIKAFDGKLIENSLESRD